MGRDTLVKDDNENGKGANWSFFVIFVSLGIVFYAVYGSVFYLIAGSALGLILSEALGE